MSNDEYYNERDLIDAEFKGWRSGLVFGWCVGVGFLLPVATWFAVSK
jgi:hypothetical protein